MSNRSEHTANQALARNAQLRQAYATRRPQYRDATPWYLQQATLRHYLIAGAVLAVICFL